MNQNGTAITGYYTELLDSSGNVLATGFTTQVFITNAGQSYEVEVGNYGSCQFAQWSGGAAANLMSFTATSTAQSFTAVYNCGTGGTGGTSSTVTVNSADQNNMTITGYYTALLDSSSNVLATGYTPHTFTTTVGQTYGVKVDNYGNCNFEHWSNGATSDPMMFSATSAAQSFTAVFNCGTSGSGGGGGGTASQVTVTSQDTSGVTISRYYTELYSSSGSVISTGFTPTTFSTTSGLSYSIQVDNYGSCSFAHWSDGVSSDPRSFAATSTAQSFTAVFNCGTSGSGGSGGSSTGITIFDHRIPANYWASCFATTCTNPLASCNTSCTGPGAAMYVVLYGSNGNVVQTGFANENGLTFTGLTAGVTYYIYPSDCDLCHGSTHDVLFQYWGTSSGTAINSTRPLAVVVGESVNAWYTCTNGCTGI
ncbi:MAG: hypothetical protein ACYCPW_08975 [Nitrososphaerales archaeon]